SHLSASLGGDIPGDPEECGLAFGSGIRPDCHEHALAAAIGERRPAVVEGVLAGGAPNRIECGPFAFGALASVDQIPDEAGDSDGDRSTERERSHLGQQYEAAADAEQLDPRVAR